MMHGATIGESVRQSGLRVLTIRYYELIGLLPVPSRSGGNRRTYQSADFKRLTFIHHARELGFEIDPIRMLFALQDNPNQFCAAADVIVKARQADVKQLLGSLNALRVDLQMMIKG
jgi:DNA-binding transcriptional MerR regulator